MMKKLLPFLICFLSFTGARAQDAEAMKKHSLKIYNQGITYNDVNAAINGLHGYIATDDNIAYKDTLSMLYFSTKSYYSSLLLAVEVYKATPADFVAIARA